MIVHWNMHYPDAPRTDGGPSTTAGRKTVSYDVFSSNSEASIHTAPDVGISEALPMLIL
jgi:hypothetical protein